AWLGVSRRLLDCRRCFVGYFGQDCVAKKIGRTRKDPLESTQFPLMIQGVVILVYLVVIAVIGSVAYKRGKENTEDFFLANRSIGSLIFFLSIFATNMPAFAILGSSGQSYRQGI